MRVDFLSKKYSPRFVSFYGLSLTGKRLYILILASFYLLFYETNGPCLV